MDASTVTLAVALVSMLQPAKGSVPAGVDERLPRAEHRASDQPVESDETEPEETESDDTSTDEFSVAKTAIARARKMYAQGEYQRAIVMLERVYDMLPGCRTSQRDQLYSDLGAAHWAAYGATKVESHLTKAQMYYTLYSETLCFTDEYTQRTRRTIAKKLVEIQREIDRVEAERISRAEREGRAREKAERDAHDRRRHRLALRISSSGVGFGVASVGIATVGLALGAQIDRDGERLASDPNMKRSYELRSLRRRGTVYNQMAWTAGVLGGVLLISGTVGLVVTSRNRPREAQTRARLAPSPRGLEVRF